MSLHFPDEDLPVLTSEVERKEAFDLAGYVQRAKSGPCFICAILAGAPGYDFEQIVFEDEHHIAFLDRYPTMPGKVNQRYPDRGMTADEYAAAPARVAGGIGDAC